MKNNQIRKDYLLDRWSIIAANRDKRPRDFKRPDEPARSEIDENCAFCPGNEKHTPPEIDRIERGRMWGVRCFPNKFAATTLDAKGEMNEHSRPAYGSHEVIVETPKHNEDLADLSIEHMLDLFEMYKRRIDAINTIEGVEYVSLFKNKGHIAGASLIHAHTQLIGLPMVPPVVQKKADASKKECQLCEIIKKEQYTIFEDDNVAAFAHYAARFPLEAHIMPKRHVGSLSDLNESELKSFVYALKHILEKLAKINAPYNFALFENPAKCNMHLHLEVYPRLALLAGFELGSEMYINSMPPEKAVEFYK